MLGRRRAEVELVEDVRTCFSTAASVTHECLGDPAVGLPLGHRCEDVALARAQAVQRPGGAPTAEHAPDHLRIEGAPTVRDAFDRVGERLDIADTLL